MIVRVKPGDDLRKLAKKGVELVLSAGVYKGGLSFTGIDELQITADPGAIIRGGQVGLKFDGCNDLQLRELEVESSGRSGIMVVNSIGLGCLHLKSHGHGLRGSGSGLLTGNVSNVYVKGGSYDRNGEHGIYLSQGGDNYTIKNIGAYRNQRCGIQINAIGGPTKKGDPQFDWYSRGVVIEDVMLGGNQKEGGAAINLAGVQEAHISEVYITSHLGRYGISLWDDGEGERFSCRDVELTGLHITFEPKRGNGRLLNVHKTCKNISYEGEVVDGQTR